MIDFDKWNPFSTHRRGEMIENLDIPTRPRPAPPTLAGFYRTLGVPAFWDGARATREATHGGSVRLVRILRQAAEDGAQMEDVPELREWQAYGR